MEITKKLETIEDLELLESADFVLKKYNYHERIKAKMVA